MNTTMMSATPSATGLTPERIIQMGWSFALPFAIDTATRHGMFNALAGGPRTTEQVSHTTGCSMRGTEALLSLLASVQLLRQQDGRYALMPDTEMFLVSGKPSFIGGLFQHLVSNVIPKYPDLMEIVRSGVPANDMSNAEIGPEFFRKFVADLMPLNFPAANAAAQHLRARRSTQTSSILDVAAGSGVWGIAMAQAFPNAVLTLLDLPPVLEVTRAIVERFGLSSRSRELAGSFREVDFGRGHSIVTVGHVLHSEGEDNSRRLLRKIYDALGEDGTIVIGEFLFAEDRTTPTAAAVMNMNMIVTTQSGRIFTFAELSDWLKECGFRNVRTLEVPAPSPLILADR